MSSLDNSDDNFIFVGTSTRSRCHWVLLAPPVAPPAMMVADHHSRRQRFEQLPSQAGRHRQVSTHRTRKETDNRPHAGSVAQGYTVRPRTGIAAEKFHTELIPVKSLFDMDRVTGLRSGQQCVLAGSMISFITLVYIFVL